MRAGTLILILGGLALVLGVLYFLMRPAAAAAGDSRPWWQRGADAITPDRFKVGYAGFGIDLDF